LQAYLYISFTALSIAAWLSKNAMISAYNMAQVYA